MSELAGAGARRTTGGNSGERGSEDGRERRAPACTLVIFGASGESGTADFDQVLVYDVSRWGRFPDTDEAAHYEYLCKRAGITVHYCAEQFENDNSTTSNLLKALKRTMAGEYSRELSVKVCAGQRRLVAMGFWQGGTAPFGMLRQLVSATGEPKQTLKP